MKRIILYSIILILIFIFYNIEEIIQFPAQGAHLWRQADCLSVVWNYKLNHASFLVPQMFNLISDEGKGVAEFPIFYFISASFKKPEIALRIIHFIVLVFCSIRLYSIAYYFLKNHFFAFSVLILFLTSPLIIFYGINFLSDVPALSFAIIGLSFYFTNKKNRYNLFVCILFLCISSLLKASYFLYLIGIILFELYYKKENKTNFLFLFIFILIPIVWYGYAYYINYLHHNEYYFLSTKSILSMKLYDIGLAFWRIIISWSKTYFWRATSVLLIINCIVFLYRKKHLELYQTLIFSLLITFIFVFLFLEKLIIHEYYYAFFFIAVLFMIIGFFYTIAQFKNQLFVKAFTILFLIINIVYCKNYVEEKQAVQRIDNELISVDFQKFLIKNGCDESKTVFCFDDISLNQQLYAIKRKGYTQYNNWEKKLKENKIDYILTNKNNSYTIKNILNSDLRKFTIIEYKNYILIKI